MYIYVVRTLVVVHVHICCSDAGCGTCTYMFLGSWLWYMYIYVVRTLVVVHVHICF
jgi:hypothetical protein